MHPATTSHSFFDTPTPIAFAHRGGDEVFPENTLAAFQDAYELGYRYFETDVHYTVDHELVAFHDDDLKRVLGINIPIASLTKQRRLKLQMDARQHVTLLSDLLRAFPDVYFHIDAKSREAVTPLAETITAHHAEARVCVSSFSAKNVLLLRDLLPDVYTTATRKEIVLMRYRRSPTATLPAIKNRILSVPTHLLYNRQPQRVLFITPKSVQKFHDKGCKVFVWTINSEMEMTKLLDAGVDGLFTDKLRLLKKVLQSRGQWIEPA